LVFCQEHKAPDLRWLFQEGPSPQIMEAADMNGDNSVNIADLTYLVDYLFRGGPGPVHGE
jgi:hypothetical protein